MNTAAAPAESCFQCGEALPATRVTAHIGAIARNFCCQGCARASAWIQDAGLLDYYRLRQENGPKISEATQNNAVWDEAIHLADQVQIEGDTHTLTLAVDGMRCAACAWLIHQALSQQAGISEVSANAITGRVRLRWQPAHIRLSQIVPLLHQLGYTPYLTRGASMERARRKETQSLLIKMGLALLGATQTMMFSEALYLDTAHAMSTATQDGFRWLCFLMATPVVFYAGSTFISGMFAELRYRRLGMNTLSGSAILLAYFASLYQTLTHGQHVWFDAAVMFVLFLLAAQYLEIRARRRATAQLDALARAQPMMATVIRLGERQTCPSDALQVDDLLHVAAGESVSGDGLLQDEHALFDESLLTGEAEPIAKQKGDLVMCGSIAYSQSARIQLTHVGQATRIAQLVRCVESAQAHKPRLAQFADRIAQYFVLIIFMLGLGVYLYWHQANPVRAFEIALAVLVVSCPCALALALPTALSSAHQALSKIGVLSIGANALHTLTQIDTVIFDKTGTLTRGKPTLTHAHSLNDTPVANYLGIASALTRGSHHPIAHAFQSNPSALAPPLADQITTHPGQGISGTVNGILYRLGRADFVAGQADDAAIYLGDGVRALARFELADPVRDDALAALQQLKAEGLHLILLSGDALAPVKNLAEHLHLTDYHARQSPEQKLAYMQGLQAAGHIVAMVGDGMNDAPVLSGADVSIAMASGAALAHRAADIVLCGDHLSRLIQARALAKRTAQIIRQNIGWAIAYNLLAIPLAATGHIHPGLAALGMAGSSLWVTLNALRIHAPTVNS